MSSEQSPDATRWQDTRFIGRTVTSSRTVVANGSGFSPPRARKAASEGTQSTATTADSDTPEDVLGTWLVFRSPSTLRKKTTTSKEPGASAPYVTPNRLAMRQMVVHLRVFCWSSSATLHGGRQGDVSL